MNETYIEWVRNPDGSQGYTWNPITGCLNHDNGLCKGGGFPCYAYKLANGRLKKRYLANIQGIYVPATMKSELLKAAKDPFYPRFWEERLVEMTKRNDRLWYDGTNRKYARAEAFGTSKGIFVCDMGDFFGKGVPVVWTEKVLDEIWGNKGYDRFYILTKQAARLPEFSPFPENAWVGVTATNEAMFSIASNQLAQINARKKFYSFEPLLSWDFKADWDKWNKCLIDRLKAVDWIIIGACTGTHLEMLNLYGRLGDAKAVRLMPLGGKYTLQPKIEWVREIVEAADKAGVKVFLKDNLRPLLRNDPDFYDDIPQGDHPNYDSIAMLRQEMPK